VLQGETPLAPPGEQPKRGSGDPLFGAVKQVVDDRSAASTRQQVSHLPTHQSPEVEPVACHRHGVVELTLTHQDIQTELLDDVVETQLPAGHLPVDNRVITPYHTANHVADLLEDDRPDAHRPVLPVHFVEAHRAPVARFTPRHISGLHPARLSVIY